MERKTMAAAAVLALALCAVAGAASAETWSAAYTGTVTATYEDGRTAKVFVEPDHTYTIMPASGDPIHGTWKDSGSKSCFTITDPASMAGGAPTCLPAKEYQVGDSFSGKDPSGAFTAVISGGR